MPPSAIQMRAFGSSDIGRKRSQNQDRFHIDFDLNLFLVADGMGGHEGGEIASLLSVESISKTLAESFGHAKSSPEQLLQDSFYAANSSIQARAVKEPQLQGMGTTTTAVFFPSYSQMWIGHVGDSRCYYLQEGKIWQLTRDHSLVQEKVRAGIITREEAKKDRTKNVITRSVGFEKNLDVDLYSFSPQKGDAFLLCSDGLTSMMEDSQISKIADEFLFRGENLEETVKKWIQQANEQGGEDNVTALLLWVSN